MTISGSIALVTGANGGIGSVFVSELLARGASKIYIAARNEASLADLLSTDDPRLVPLTIDVTDEAQVAQAAIDAPDVTLLINNAGYAAFEGAIAAPNMDNARREMDVNYFGTLSMTRAFAPVLAASGGGTALNVLSMLALVSLPAAASYSASKAAGLSLNRSLRAELAAQGTKVIGVLAVQTDTAMGAALPEPRMTPQEVVSDALDAVEAGLSDEIAAGGQTKAMHEKFMADPKGVQQMLSSMLPQAA